MSANETVFSKKSPLVHLKKAKVKHTSGLYSEKRFYLADSVLHSFDSLTPKLAYIWTERFKAAFDSGGKVRPKRHVIAFIQFSSVKCFLISSLVLW